MNSKYAQEMIKKMVESIHHQAETNVKQIQASAEESANQIKTKTFYNSCGKIDEDMALKQKLTANNKAVQLSIENGKQRMKILKVREEAVDQSMKIAEEKLKKFVKTPEYSELLSKLCAQSLLAMDEEKVEFAVTAADAKIFENQKDNIIELYKQKAPKPNKSKSDDDDDDEVKIDISLSSYVLPDAAIGGCVAIAKEGTLQCSNTLMDRLVLSCKDLYPQIRQIFLDQGDDSE
ncbi:hypothetical protein M9Y10_023530 [Tritrichomonas musculus]|uniref:Vacuolar ATP synthase subunit E n=1 Tax=Tritrichomonas musculus TaxID=1915356 RepID=A0ABR2KVD6_9EUKA